MIVLKYSALNGIYSQCPYISSVDVAQLPCPGLREVRLPVVVYNGITCVIKLARCHRVPRGVSMV